MITLTQQGGEAAGDMPSPPWVTDEVAHALVKALTAPVLNDGCERCGFNEAHDDCDGLCGQCWEWVNR
mgnify:FL=1